MKDKKKIVLKFVYIISVFAISMLVITNIFANNSIKRTENEIGYGTYVLKEEQEDLAPTKKLSEDDEERFNSIIDAAENKDNSDYNNFVFQDDLDSKEWVYCEQSQMPLQYRSEYYVDASRGVELKDGYANIYKLQALDYYGLRFKEARGRTY